MSVGSSLFVQHIVCHVLQVLHMITYIKFELWQFTLVIQVNILPLLCDLILPVLFDIEQYLYVFSIQIPPTKIYLYPHVYDTYCKTAISFGHAMLHKAYLYREYCETALHHSCLSLSCLWHGWHSLLGLVVLELLVDALMR